ncbi:MAG: ATP-binding protein [Candidatus Nanohaloarchaea archaeon]|nr:ATP-binding protein [Candidatus Nanohaloarchaea archaeon]
METLELFNPWWKEGEISRELAPEYRRRMFEELKRLQETDQITLISGLRRVGKTTLMYQLIEDLLDQGTEPTNILYFSFDEKIQDPTEILERYQDRTGTDWQNERCHIFLDEIQKLDDWSNKLKILYDTVPKSKITVSGSSSFRLEKDADLNLAGRHFQMQIPPLSFKEYLQMSGSDTEPEKPEMYRRELEREFREYLKRPFPETATMEDAGLIKRYIKDNIIEKIVRVDLSDEFDNIREELLTRLIDLFYDQPGTYLNYNELANELGIGKETLSRHLSALEYAYIIRRVKNYRPNTRTTSRKLQRIYPFHWSLQFGWNGDIDTETVVSSMIDARYYWRKQGKEVDFLRVEDKKIEPIEVKESEKVRKSSLRDLISFIQKFDYEQGTLAYNGREETLETEDIKVEKRPVWRMALEEGA